MRWLIVLMVTALLASMLLGCKDDVVEPEAAKSMVSEQDGLLLDVRTPREFAGGHIEGAVNIPVQELGKRMDELPRDRPIIVYCRSGNRSAKAKSMLEAKGYEGVHDLGAMSNWKGGP